MKRLARSFGYAFDGVVEATRLQPNLAIHFIVTALVLVAAIALHLTLWAFVAILLLATLVLGLELTNTAIEAQVDLATLELHPVAKRAKDAAAGAVLIASVGSLLCGLAIFADAAVTGYRRPAVPVLDAQTCVAALGIAAVLMVLTKARCGTSVSGRAIVPWAVAALCAFLVPAKTAAWIALIVLALAATLSRRPRTLAALGAGPLLGVGSVCLCLLAHDPRML